MNGVLEVVDAEVQIGDLEVVGDREGAGDAGAACCPECPVQDCASSCRSRERPCPTPTRRAS